MNKLCIKFEPKRGFSVIMGIKFNENDNVVPRLLDVSPKSLKIMNQCILM